MRLYSNIFCESLTRGLLVLPAFLASYNAYAEWEVVGDSGDLQVYIDRVEKIDDVNIKFWSLYNYKDKSSKGAMSSKEKHLGNCKDLSISTTYIVAYSQAMGTGNVVDSKESIIPSFTPVVPDSVGETSLVSACLKAHISSPALEAALQSFVANLAQKSNLETDTKKIDETVKAVEPPANISPAEEVTAPIISAVSSEEGKFKVSVKSIQANVRELPDIASKVLGTVKSGTILIALNFSGNYYQVVTSAGKGFIHKSTVELLPLDKQQIPKDGAAI